jgi:hypothetical protein
MSPQENRIARILQERQEPIPTGGFWGVNVLPASRRQKEETRISSGHFQG